MDLSGPSFSLMVQVICRFLDLLPGKSGQELMITLDSSPVLMVQCCLNMKWSLRLTYWNTWSLASGAIWEGCELLGGGAMSHWDWPLTNPS